MQSVELGVISSYSFLRGASSPEALISRAAQLEIGTLAITDYNGLYGVPRFYRAAKKQGIRTIIGAQVFISSIGRLRLLCENQLGYQNLSRLLTIGHQKESKGQCIVSPKDLPHLAQGIICLYGGSTIDLSANSVSTLQNIFGALNLFIEIHNHLTPETEKRTQRLIDLAEACRTPLVATNDVHHATASEKKLHDILFCIRTKQTLSNAGKKLFPNSERRLKPEKEITALFSNHLSALNNRRLIAQRCQFDFSDLGYKFPQYPAPKGQSLHDYLQSLAHKGAVKRYGKISPPVQKQLLKELNLIKKLNLAGYFLIVWDICRFAKDNNILCQGRGSAANSLICFVLEITAIDPIKLDLLFERFLSEERGEWPDIDIDFPSGSKRESVIQYIYKKYGPHGVAMTANVITFRDRSALRESGKALGFSQNQVDLVAKSAGRWADINNEDELHERLIQAGVSPKSPLTQLWIQMAQALLHHPRHLGQHSGGMVIAAGRLDATVPIEPASMPNRRVIQWDKDDCAYAGIIKVDILGLGMLAALEKTLPLIEQTEGKQLELSRIPPNDSKVFDLLCRADTVGVFQVESRAQMATLPRLKPRTFYDLVIEIALIRPGPVSGNMVHPFLRRRSGAEAVSYPHPCLKNILQKTLGVPIFQEQVMRISMVAANFSGGEAEELRRAMGFKHSRERMPPLMDKLKKGMSRNNIPASAQEEIMNSIASFANYGFPESHSASFALLAYASAYLKTYHHGAFTCALLNAWPLGFYTPDTLIKDAKRHGIRVLPLHIHHSNWDCTLDDKATIRLGFRYAQNIRQASIERVITERQHSPFQSIKEFERRCQLSNSELATLAELGAFESLPTKSSSKTTRRQAMWAAASLKERSQGLLSLIQEHTHQPALKEMNLQERIAADYRKSGLSVGSHPLAFIRFVLNSDGTHQASTLLTLNSGVKASVAGLITVRQRPMTAKGFLFITLEDETGFANLIIPPATFEKYNSIIRQAEGLWAEGLIQNQDNVVHLKVSTLIDLTTKIKIAQSSPA